MSRIVFAWELGNSRGHLCRLIPIARRLAAAGHTIYLVTKNLVLTRQLAGDASFIVLPCPAPESAMSIGRDPGSYSDILAMHGFGDAGVFQALTRAWQDIFSMTGADLLIADHAPLALVSARLAGLRSIHLGDGFTVPPLLSPLPEFRTQDAASRMARLTLETELLRTINHRLELAGKTSCQVLAQAFQGNVALLATIPELDPYYASRQPQAHFLGRIPYTDTHARIKWGCMSRPHVFLYLNAQAPCIRVLDLIAASEVEAIAVIPDIPDAVAMRYAGNASLRIHQTFMDLDTILTGCDVLVAHGGQGITLESLRHGVPLLLLPGHVEQLLTTACVARNHAGLGILPDYVEQRFAEVLNTLLVNDQYRLGAQALQQKYWSNNGYCALDAAIAHITHAEEFAQF